MAEAVCCSVAIVDVQASEYSMIEDMSQYEKFEGKYVRVYLYSGAVISGRATFKKGWVEVENDRDGGKLATCNLRHIISISLI